MKRFGSLRVVVVLFALAAAWTGARAQDRTFVYFAAIPGGSTDSAHPAWIDAYALDTKVSVSGGTSSFAEVAFLKGTDRATPLLHDAVAVGTMFPTAAIEVCRQGTSGQECYYRIDLTNVQVTGVDLSGSSCVGSAACTPTQTESITLNYTRIKWTYTPWTGGTAGTPIIKCFDLPTRQRC